MIRVGLIGRGMAGTVFHAPLIRAVPSLELVAIAGSGDASALLRNPQVELVIVATPNSSHFELARSALENGKHVVVDKPLVTSTAEATELSDLASERGLVLTVFHNRRWDGDFLTVQELLRSSRLGDVMLYEANWDRFRPQLAGGWRETPALGAGVLWNLGPHLIDQMLVLFGSPDAVQADITSQRPDALVDDYFRLTFEYGDRRMVLSASSLVTRPRPRFSIHGTEGSFLKSGLDPQEAALAAGEDPLTYGFGWDLPASFGTLFKPDRSGEQISTQPGRYLAFYEGVAAAIRDEGPAPVDLRSAKLGVAIIEAARKSALSGCRQLIDSPAVFPRSDL